MDDSDEAPSANRRHAKWLRRFLLLYFCFFLAGASILTALRQGSGCNDFLSSELRKEQKGPPSIGIRIGETRDRCVEHHVGITAKFHSQRVLEK
mmetsp:Transcript_7186/g.14771  ORF Transcript_7186/g.14771 Transcript_7186/m.14771 type:complete len:94 (+) Transcript_7186:320-601(+)